MRPFATVDSHRRRGPNAVNIWYYDNTPFETTGSPSNLTKAVTNLTAAVNNYK